MKLVQYNKCEVDTMDIGGLVLLKQDISSYSAEYVPRHFQLFMG